MFQRWVPRCCCAAADAASAAAAASAILTCRTHKCRSRPRCLCPACLLLCAFLPCCSPPHAGMTRPATASSTSSRALWRTLTTAPSRPSPSEHRLRDSETLLAPQAGDHSHRVPPYCRCLPCPSLHCACSCPCLCPWSASVPPCRFYAETFPPSGSQDAALLDICSSWISHYPPGYTAGRVAGAVACPWHACSAAPAALLLCRGCDVGPCCECTVLGRNRAVVLLCCAVLAALCCAAQGWA